MLHLEFEEMTGLIISGRDYHEIVEPMYMALPEMSKAEFCKYIRPFAEKLAEKYAAQREAEKYAAQKLVFVETNGVTPNGCYSLGFYAKVVGADIRTGKILVRNPSMKEGREIMREHSCEWNPQGKYTCPGYGHADFHLERIKVVGVRNRG